jgi:hypothetical protein
MPTSQDAMSALEIQADLEWCKILRETASADAKRIIK